MASIVPAVCPITGPVLDLNSAIMKGAQAFVYAAETTTPLTAFADYELTTPLPNPLPVNAYGYLPGIYVGVGDYKIVIRDGAGSLVTSYEHLPGGQQSATASGATSDFVTGDLKTSYIPVPQTGWVIANGGTIGGGNSAATARANADTQSLFIALWNTDPTLVVTPARGSSALQDFNASKTIATPDLRARMPAGCDKMGAQQTAGRFTSFTTPTPDQVGTTFGAESATLNIGQLPIFTPSVTAASAGGVTPTATADTQGAHAHGGTTNNPGDHAHTYVVSNFYNATASGGGGGVNSGGGGSVTGYGGNHTHTIATDTQGAHTHNITVAPILPHTHVLTAAPIGSGNPFGSLGPTILVYWFIKL